MIRYYGIDTTSLCTPLPPRIVKLRRAHEINGSFDCSDNCGNVFCKPFAPPPPTFLPLLSPPPPRAHEGKHTPGLCPTCVPTELWGNDQSLFLLLFGSNEVGIFTAFFWCRGRRSLFVRCRQEGCVPGGNKQQLLGSKRASSHDIVRINGAPPKHVISVI